MREVGGQMSGEPQEAPATPVKRTAAHRVLSLLEAFSVGGGALTLSEISRHADLSLTTTHRLVREVLEWGGLDIDTNGRYRLDRKSTRLNSSHVAISYAVFCLKKKTITCDSV